MLAPVLQVDNLRTYFKAEHESVRAVDGVSFELQQGETLGIVGESGSGKSVTCLSILGLVPRPPAYHPSGRVVFGGRDLLTARPRDLRQVRGKEISMIFQDPMSSLNPFLTVERQLTEVLQVHQGMTRRESRAAAIDMLGEVGIPSPETRIDHYPHQFSGGMRQRVMIAMALLCRPKVLIADEPTTALDVTIQAQILELIGRLRRDFGTSVILITHDLGVVAGTTDRVLVMYAGRVVEQGSTDDVFARPSHPYTRGLLGSVPRLDAMTTDSLAAIPGLPPDLANLPGGCPFHPRCGLARAECQREYPPTVVVGQSSRSASCWVVAEDQMSGGAAGR
ncbi:MAG: ABC transporter ATP-binding protein [Pirellulales bacterium]